MSFHGWVLLAAAWLVLWCLVDWFTNPGDDVNELLRKRRNK